MADSRRMQESPPAQPAGVRAADGSGRGSRRTRLRALLDLQGSRAIHALYHVLVRRLSRPALWTAQAINPKSPRPDLPRRETASTQGKTLPNMSRQQEEADAIHVAEAEISRFIESLTDEAYAEFDPDYAETEERMPTSLLRDRVRNYLAQKAMLSRVGDEAIPSGMPRIFTVGKDDERSRRVEERMTRALADVDEKTVKQRARRSQAIQDLTMALTERVEGSTNVVFLRASELVELMQEYQQARKEGISDADLDWIPLSAYVRKIVPENRAPLRPILAGEAGVFQMASNPSSRLSGRITCVRDQDLNIHSDRVMSMARPQAEGIEIEDDEEDDDGTPLDIPELLPGPGSR